jgi:hypothetical protein
MREWIEIEDAVGAVMLFAMAYGLFFLGYGLGF